MTNHNDVSSTFITILCEKDTPYTMHNTFKEKYSLHNVKKFGKKQFEYFLQIF